MITHKEGEEKRWLGRYFNEATKMWEFEDGSGDSYPDEMRKEFEIMSTRLGFKAIGNVWALFYLKVKYKNNYENTKQ